MRRLCWTQTTPLIAGLLSCLLFAILAVPLGAQPAHQTHSSYYDITKEVTLNGTVTAVLKAAPRGMVPGSHITLETESGPVDASLGRWGMRGKGALSVALGEHVEVIGVIKTLKDRHVFIARTMTVGRQVYEMRNQHGIPVSPISRERSSQKAAQKGVSQ